MSELLDTADVIGVDADDPTPAEITDPAHPDYVEPCADATPIGDDD